jgi:hypothetical protein
VCEATVENDRRTRGESSLSTRKACSAIDARRAVGRGMSIVLGIRLALENGGECIGKQTVSRESQGLAGVSSCPHYYYFGED